VVALHDNCIVVANGDCGGSEGDIASSITELTNGEEQLSGKLWDNMSGALWVGGLGDLTQLHGWNVNGT